MRRLQQAMVLGAVFGAAMLLIAEVRAQGDQGDPDDELLIQLKRDQIRFERLGEAHGARQYRRGRWGVVAIDIANFSDEPAELLGQIGFRPNATLLHARRVYAPANSVRRTWTTIRMPMETTTDQRQELYGQLIDLNNGVATVKARAEERRQHQTAIRVVNDPLITGIIVPAEDYETGQTLDPGYEMVIAARGGASLGRQVALIGDRYLPAIPEAYDAIDQLVLYNDRFAEEPVGCAAIRSWLHDGGHIWLQLDRVKLESVFRLLGERFRCEEVDRVDLHKIDIETLEPRRGVTYLGKREFEAPVPFVRLAVEDVVVTHRVNGWPAAFTIPYGRGRVVATALGGGGWVTEAKGSRNYAKEGRFDPLQELNELELIIRRKTTPATEQLLSDYLQAHIGYQIVGRSIVVTMLCAFCLFLIVCGGVLAARGGLERMTWIAPLGALAAAAPLIYLGMQAQQSAPPSVAMAQFVQVGDASRHAQVSGALAMYRPSPETLSVGSDTGGLFELDWQGLENSMRRMVRSDWNRWRWEDVRLTAGVRKAAIQQAIVLPETAEVRGTFDENGFQGTRAGLASLEDVVLASPGRPSMSVRGDGEQFVATTSDQLAKDEYVVAALLTDEQRRRQEIYSRLFASSTQDNPFPSRRMLLGWREPFDLGFQFPEDTKVVGGALVATSLLIDRPESGAKIRIPSPFLHFRSTTSPSGFGGGSPLYNARTGEWITSESATDAWLLVSPPEEVLPLTVSRATIRLKCTIPSRDLTLSAAQSGSQVKLLNKPNAIGPIEFVIDDPSMLEINEDGGFRIGLAVSEPRADTESELRWNIDYLDVELEATTN